MNLRFANLPCLVLPCLVIVAISPVAAQECRDSLPKPALNLAKRFAPVLRFGPGERYFPTIPFFTAFEGRALSDSNGIAPLSATGRASWDTLDTHYRRRVTVTAGDSPVLVPRHAAVFYRVRCLQGKQPKQLWGFLRNDPQAWRRTGLDTLFALGLRDASFTVVEYYLYYLRDVGLQGHPHDIEQVFVFLPRRIDVARAAAREGPSKRAAEAQILDSLLDSLRVIVGTGHSRTTPNNVLVLVGTRAAQFKLPSILVELGGHSSAPDVDRDFEFHIGVDVNWNLASDSWGTRDIQTVSGSGFLGRYHADMTFPRRPANSVLLTPRGEEARAQVDSARRQAAEQQAPQRVPIRADSAMYSLVAVRHLEGVYRHVRRLRRAGTATDTAAVLDSLRLMVDSLLKPALGPEWNFAGFPEASSEALLAAARHMQRWSGNLETNGRDGRQPLIWEHPNFRGSPVQVAKRRLYRPTLAALQNVGDVGSLFNFSVYTALGRGGQQLQVGMTVPALRSVLSIPGVLEMHVGAYSRRIYEDGFFSDPTNVSFAMLYERHYRRTFSWYVRPIDYVSRRDDLENDPQASNFVFGFGGSIMPLFNFADRVPFIADKLRLRAGLRLDAEDWEPRVARFELQTTFYIR